MLFMYWGAQNCTLHSSCVSPELRSGEGSPHWTFWQLLASLAPREHCWLMVTAVHWDAQVFSAELFPASNPPACTGASSDYSRLQDFTLAFAELQEANFLFASFSSLSRSLSVAAQLKSISHACQLLFVVPHPLFPGAGSQALF